MTLQSEHEQTLILGPMPQKARPDRVVAAGPWCFAGQEDFFPDWEETFSFAPDILADREEEDACIREAEVLATDIIPPLAESLAPDSNLPVVYWETLLAPYTITIAKLITQHWHLVRAMISQWGSLPIRTQLLPENSSFHFATDADVVLHGSLNPVLNHYILSLLLRPVLPKDWKTEDGAQAQEIWAGKKQQGLRGKLKDTLRRCMLRMPFPRMKGMTLGQAFCYSRALSHPCRTADRSRLLSETFSSAATGITLNLPFDVLPLFKMMLPESIRKLRHPHTLSVMRKPRTRAASIIAYEDAAYRQELAVWRARGGRLLSVQHGGNYGQMKRICAMELVEYTQHAFATWGWDSYEGSFGNRTGTGNFIPLPYPQLARIQNSWQQKNDTLIFVGTEMPTVAYQLDSHPSPGQFLQYRDDKQWFLETLGSQIREKTLYRPYFPVPGTLKDAEWVIPKFPQIHLCTGPLDSQILGCRLLVLDHHGTTLLEAMAANIPTVCYWNPQLWPVSSAFEKILEKMQTVGMWNSSAEAGALHVQKIWENPAAWWQSPGVQAIRQEFLDSYALLPEQGCEDARWVQCLKNL